MNFYILQRTDEDADYDENHAFLVAADSEDDARTYARSGSDVPFDPTFANANARQWAGNEDGTIWLAPTTTCTQLHDDMKPGLLLRDFLYG